jgi:hypothetical protein
MVRKFFLVALLFGAAPVLAVTSQEGREKSRIQLLAKPIGFSPYFSLGLSVGLLFDSQNILEFGLLNSISSIDASSAYVSNVFDLSLRRFFGNSFNLRAGLSYRNLRINYNRRHVGLKTESQYGSYKTDHRVNTVATAASIGPNFSIGNQWQMAKFLLGCDWFGFYLPVVKVGDEKLSNENNLTDEQRKEVEKDATAVNMWPAPRFVFLNVGASF